MADNCTETHQYLALTRWLALPLLSFLLSGCLSSSSGSATANPAQNYDRASTPWFCQVDANYAGWDCVRDTDETNRPTPRRMPVAAQTLPVGSPDPITGAEVQTADPDAASTVLRQAPKHVRLSYQPEEPVAILDLPAT
ncbi:MAG: hypothetical protein AAF993_11930, partial [Pseudomonadota bacterium]